MRKIAIAFALVLSSGAGCSANHGPAATSHALTWSDCRDDFECASVEVPLDYASPNGDTIAIALLRAPASGPEPRLGSVLVNPGGPGVAMVDQLARTYRALRLAFPVATARFDIVAFDWRGIGASAPIHCVDDAFFDALRAIDLAAGTKADADAIDAARAALVAGCTANVDPRLLSNMHTEAAARDLDRIRQALGDETLNYLGFSYGTLLGATYATLFPNRVRAFVLDSPVFPPADLGARIAMRAKGYENGLARFEEGCAKDASCTFHGGTDPKTIADSYDALMAKIASAQGGLPAGARTLSRVDAGLALADGLRTGSWPKLGADLAKAEAGDGTALLARADAASGRSTDGHYDSTFLGDIAIACLDLPFLPGTTMTDFAAVASASPQAHAAGVPWAMCIDWPWHRANAPIVISAPSAAPMLVVAGANDPIVTYAEAEQTIDALANGSHLVTYDGEGHSASLHSACVRSIVTDFFVDPTIAPAASHCAPE